MNKKKFCGNIIHNGIQYGVLLEETTGLVWVIKPADSFFGEGNYNNFKARSKTEALELAPKMLESIGL